MTSVRRVAAGVVVALAGAGLLAVPSGSPAGATGAAALHRAVASAAPGIDARLVHGNRLVHRSDGTRAEPQKKDGSGRITVYVDGPDRDAVVAAVRAEGGIVTGSLPGVVAARVPAAALQSLAERPGVTSVRPPNRAVATSVTSEGVAASGADAWQSIGTGAGVKVGIVDLGFENLAVAQASGDLPQTGAGLTVTNEPGCNAPEHVPTDHGTAVAEIVHDMAPQAELFLVCIDDSVDLGAAADFLHAQGVTVVNMSVGFYGAGRGDGTGEVSDVIRRSRQAGLLWSVAAGNDAQDYFVGKAADKNGDGFVEFSGTDPFNGFRIAPGGSALVEIDWDAWPTTTSELDLVFMLARHLPDPNDPLNDPDLLAVVGSDQSGSGPLPPVTGIVIENPSGEPLTIWTMVFNFNAPATMSFDMTVAGAVNALQYRQAAGSVSDPASSPYALAVGAVCVKNGTLEPFSSQGPTVDGRRKPDLAAFDGVSTTTFGSASTGTTSCTDGFLGTSSAAPHVTGAAALVKSANPSFDAAQIESYLEEHATSGTVNKTGHGTLDMGPLATPQLRQGSTYKPLTAPTRILDTRTDVGGHKAPIGAGEVVTLSVPGLDLDATAVAINLTGTGPTQPTHMDVFPETNTGTSTLNLVTNQTAAVFTMVALGPNHTIRIRNAAGSAHAVVDLLGQYVTSDTGATYVPKNPPARLLDTRTTIGGHLAKLAPNEVYALQVRGVAGVPDDATSVVVNLTGVNQTAQTFLSLFPKDYPGTSTLNLNAKSPRSNLAVVGIADDGMIRIRNANGGSVNAIIDLQGWFVPTGGAKFYPLDSQTRFLDTRTGNGLRRGALGPETTILVQGAELYGVPYNATAVAFNLTAVSPTSETFVEAWPAGLTRPSGSNINMLAGEVDPNAVVAGTGTDGMVALFNKAGSTHLVADIYGYFAP